MLNGTTCICFLAILDAASVTGIAGGPNGH